MQHGSAKQAPPIFNLDEALARVDGDRQLLGELAALFLEECPLMLAEIRKALVRHDAKALLYSAHTLKGSVGNFGVLPVVEAAFTLEKMGRQGDLATAQTAFIELETELARLRPALTALAKERVISGD